MTNLPVKPKAWARQARRAVEQLLFLARDRDFLGLLVLASTAVPHFLCSLRCVVVTRGPADFLLPPIRRSMKVVCRRVAEADLSSLDFLPNTDESTPQQLRERFGRSLALGHEGFVAELEGKVAAYSWVDYGNCHIPEVGFEWRLGRDEAHTYRSYVHPSRRLSRIYGELLHEMRARLLDRNVRSCVGHGGYLNRYSLNTHSRLGFRVIGTIALLELPLLRIQRRRLPPELGGPGWAVRLRRRRAGSVNRGHAAE